MDSELICNFKKCRKSLTSVAWVTSCSHVFCIDHGNEEFNRPNQKHCPACKTELSSKYDIVRADLQPTEEYKSMALAGQRPETIIEVCSRAMALWMYQNSQEKLYHEHSAKQAKDKAYELEKFYEKKSTDTITELNAVQIQNSDFKKENEELIGKLNNLSEKFLERSRYCQKLQAQNDSLKRRNINTNLFSEDHNDVSNFSGNYIRTNSLPHQLEVPHVFNNQVRNNNNSNNSDTSKNTNDPNYFLLQPFQTSTSSSPGVSHHLLNNASRQAQSNAHKETRFNMPFGSPPLDGEIAKRLTNLRK